MISYAHRHGQSSLHGEPWLVTQCLSGARDVGQRVPDLTRAGRKMHHTALECPPRILEDHPGQ